MIKDTEQSSSWISTAGIFFEAIDMDCHPLSKYFVLGKSRRSFEAVCIQVHNCLLTESTTVFSFVQDACMTSPVNHPTFDDNTLLIQIAKHDQIALSTLYDRYARIIYAIAFRSLRSAEESEEVVLDVFAQVWRIADRYDPHKSRADTWIFMLARSRVLDRLRKLQSRKPSSGEVLDIAEIQVPSSSVDPINAAMVSERREQVRSVLGQIPAEQRLVIELAYYQGLSHSEIAQTTGISLGTVKTRIRLGLNKLRLALGNGEVNGS
jgi:RNA polymerase sigma-70 factor, ECF subfamily